jgi:ABC-type multidrug transport system fused ATPase/permease subunit
VLIDGPMFNPSRSSLRPNRHVSQEVVLFDDTVFNNIAFGRQNATKRTSQAAKLAYAHEVHRATTPGLCQHGRRKGIKLSGGERQRLAIAQRILRDPPLLIWMRRPALDTESERVAAGVEQSHGAPDDAGGSRTDCRPFNGPTGSSY